MIGKAPRERKKVLDFVRLIDRLITESAMTQREIADALGYEKANIITMFKMGTTRVPLDKVPALAVALGKDPVDLVGLWLRDYEPGLKAVLDAHLFAASKTEKEWIARLRETFPEGVPPLDERFEAPLAQIAKTAA